MKDNFTRRDFIKTGVIGAGLFMIGTLSTKVLAGDKVNKKVTFKPVKEGKKGCARCKSAVTAMLKDAKMNAELTELMPDNSEITFYVRRFPSTTKIPENSIAVGNCAGPLKSNAMVFVQGCTREINTEYVFNSIVKQLKNSKR